jgi:hypothetical protein
MYSIGYMGQGATARISLHRPVGVGSGVVLAPYRRRPWVPLLDALLRADQVAPAAISLCGRADAQRRDQRRLRHPHAPAAPAHHPLRPWAAHHPRGRCSEWPRAPAGPSASRRSGAHDDRWRRAAAAAWSRPRATRAPAPAAPAHPRDANLWRSHHTPTAPTSNAPAGGTV